MYLGLNFEDKVDRIISRLILDELSEANRHVRNSPAITRIADEKSFPELLLKEYPKISEKFKCGMVTITFFTKQHLQANNEQIGTFI